MRNILLIFLVFIAFSLEAQDNHFSQFSVSNIGLNPAIVGNQSADYKATFQKRTQWASVANPFSTIAFSFETRAILKNTSAILIKNRVSICNIFLMLIFIRIVFFYILFKCALVIVFLMPLISNSKHQNLHRIDWVRCALQFFVK